ncbi:MAG TPA: hypothetical protein VNJ12_13145 [Candidatus Dormibacteraeota bacterium]|nr:hypothetical protein [Candidatus Dormibacteraeota bacterium]
MNNKLVRFSIVLLGGFRLFLASPAARAARKSGSPITPDEFFIVSEVNMKKHQVVMEEPTQITVTMKLTSKTVFTSEQARTLPIADMRAGDTVYVTYQRDSNGVVTALTIREGPMTVQVLHRRYFHG